jgi:hypothetical protein
VRFYLDNDVDARCRRTLEQAGHVCWTAVQAGRADAPDDDQTIYATERDAVLITHDRQFTERRKRNTIGRHVRLCCEQPDGPEVLGRWLDDVTPVLEHRAHVVVEVRANGYSVQASWI